MEPLKDNNKQGGRSRTILIVLGLLAVMAVGAGAAAGAAMGGDITAEIPITVNQALIVQPPVSTGNFPANRTLFSSVSDDQAKFSVALETFRGETLTVLIPVVNQGSGEVVGEFSVTMPDIPSLIEGQPGLSLQVTGSGIIDDMVQTSANSWVFTAHPNLLGTNATGNPDGLLVTFKVSTTAMSGFFEINGKIRSVGV